MGALVFIVCSIICFFSDLVTADKPWNVTISQNPGCVAKCDDFNIIYIRASNQTSSVHMFAAASYYFSLPSLLAVYSSSPNAVAKIHWDRLNNSIVKAIDVPKTEQSYGFTLYRLLEFDDKDNIVNMSAASNASLYHTFSNMKWTKATDGLNFTSDTKLLEIMFNGSYNPYFNETGLKDGLIGVKFIISNITQRNPKLPHLQFIPGLTMQFELILSNLSTKFEHSRFGLQLILISNLSLSDQEEFAQKVIISTNDEITPGNFKTINILLNKNASRNQSINTKSKYLNPPGFLQLKPICYTDYINRDVKTSRDVYISEHQDSFPTEDKLHLVKALPLYFFSAIHNKNQQSASLRLLNVSMGTSDDGFYQNSKYIVWTASFGLGDPPVDQLSILLVGLIGLSVALLVCSVVFGVILTLVLRRRFRNNQFQPLLDDSAQRDDSIA